MNLHALGLMYAGNMKIMIAGGSGFCGRALVKHFRSRGDDVVILTRSKPSNPQQDIKSLQWDGKTLGPWASELESTDLLINLAGRSVDCRHTAKNKAVIMDSRIHSTAILGKAMRACKRPPPLWINSSTATIYPDTAGDAPTNTEGAAPGDDFSMNVAKAWEAEFFRHTIEGVRQVALRTCIVLGKGGGAFVPLRMLTRLGLGGHQGDGKQWVTWMHVDDFVGQIQFIMDHPELSGPVNCTGSSPVSNRDFMASLRRACNRRLGLPQPTTLIHVGAILIRTEAELVLKSRKVISAKLVEAGYAWQWPDLEEALVDLASP